MCVLVFLGIVALVLWLIITIFAWLMDNTDCGEGRSLLEMLKLQWEFIKGLRIW